MAVKRAPRRRKPLAERLAPELRMRMVEALTDAARERRKFNPRAPRVARKQHARLVVAAVGHALKLADDLLILTGEVEP